MTAEKLKVLDLFSGIGGFSLGLERTGGFETVAFCEKDPEAQEELRAGWPGIPIFEDVKKLRGDQIGTVDVICGGFPCQDLSKAGSQKGIKGERSGLWKEFHRLICEIRPRYALVENVRRLLSGSNGEWYSEFLSDLAEIRYNAEWDCIPASFMGAPHPRDRVYIAAYEETHPLSSDPNGLRPYLEKVHVYRGPKLPDQQECNAEQMGWWGAVPDIRRVVDGVPTKQEKTRLIQLGNSVVPYIPEMYGHAILAAEAMSDKSETKENR